MHKILILLFLVLSTAVYSQEKNSFFDSTDLIEFTIEFDISKLRKNKDQYSVDETTIDGKITLADGSEIKTSVTPRGQGSLSTNTNTPIKLQFKKEDRKGTIFKEFSKVKIFTAAKGNTRKDGELSSEDKSTISNYLLYDLASRLSPFAYKARLVKINYVDKSGKIPPYSAYSFFLEPNKNVAKRVSKEYKPKGIKVEYVDYYDKEISNSKAVKVCHLPEEIKTQVKDNLVPVIAKRLIAFEFLIGNYDFALPGFQSYMFKDKDHRKTKNSNVFKMTKKDNPSYIKYMPLAYDFDLALSMINCETSSEKAWDYRLSNNTTCTSQVEHLKDQQAVKYAEQYIDHVQKNPVVVKSNPGLNRAQNFKRIYESYVYKEIVRKYSKPFFDESKKWLNDNKEIFEMISDNKRSRKMEIEIWLEKQERIVNQ
jgi:hypothetical protein